MDLKEQGLISGEAGDHWYYRAKLAAIESVCATEQPTSILDVGAGSGFFARALLNLPTVREALCVDPGYVFERDEIVAGKPLRHRREVENSEADLVLMMDVVEHVADDVGLIADYAGKVAPSSTFLFTAPAFMWLWSRHDDYLEHVRRYTLPGLEEKIRRAGLHVEIGCYLYAPLLPIVAVARLGQRFLLKGSNASQMRDHGPVLGRLLGMMCKMEAPLFKRNRIGGITALVKARKPI